MKKYKIISKHEYEKCLDEIKKRDEELDYLKEISREAGNHLFEINDELKTLREKLGKTKPVNVDKIEENRKKIEAIESLSQLRYTLIRW